ncbi:MAG: hypothetical protein WCV50_00570 [Patescibacteria group bacterium]|jgi:photosystem II stability/assembly factor-like uncharacterized protein
MKKISTVVLILSLAFISGCVLQTSKPVKIDGGVFKSNDFGKSWSTKNSILNNGEKTGNIGNLEIRFMKFDSNDKDTIYLNSSGQGVYKSADGGENWQKTTLTSGTYKSIAINNLNNNVIYVTQGSKISKTVDGMKTWFDTYYEKRPSQNLVSLIADPFDASIVYAATTTGIIKSTDYGNTWELLNWKKPQILNLYLSNINSNTLYAWTNKGLSKSTNAGNDWTDISKGLFKLKKDLRILFINFDPNTEYFFIGTNMGIYKCTDGGNAWEEIPTLFNFKRVPMVPIVYNKNNLNEVIFSVDNILYKTIDGGKFWETLKTVPTSRVINYMISNPSDANIIYLGTKKPQTK